MPPPHHRIRKHANTDTDTTDLLQKAGKIKAFLAQQRGRTNAAATKRAWLALARDLETERRTTEAQLLALLGDPQLAATAGADTNSECAQLTQTLQQHACDLKAGAADAADMRSTLFDQVGDLSSALLHAWQQQRPDSKRRALQQQLLNIKQELAAESARLEAEAAESTTSCIDQETSAEQLLLTPESRTTIPSQASWDSGGSSCSESFRLHARAEAAERLQVDGLLERHTLAPAAAKEGVRRRHAELSDAHLIGLDEWKRMASAAGWGGGKDTGGWSAEEHSLFVASRVRTHREAASSCSNAKGPAVVLDQLALLLPGKTHQQLQEHERWYMQHCLLQRRRSDLQAAWSRRFATFLFEAERLLSEAVRIEADAAAAAADELTWGVAGEVKRDQVVEWRLVREQERREEEHRVAAEAQQVAQRQAQQQAEEDAQRALDRQAIVALQMQRAAKAAAAKEAAEQAAAAAARETAARMAAERPAVAARQTLALEQLIERHTARQKLEEAALTRQQRLDALTHHPEAAVDPLRLLQPTKCSAAEAQPEGRAFAPVHGYSTQQLMRDPRFRVLDALGRAGLRGTVAAAQAVAALQAPGAQVR